MAGSERARKGSWEGWHMSLVVKERQESSRWVRREKVAGTSNTHNSSEAGSRSLTSSPVCMVWYYWETYVCFIVDMHLFHPPTKSLKSGNFFPHKSAVGHLCRVLFRAMQLMLPGGFWWDSGLPHS